MSEVSVPAPAARARTPSPVPTRHRTSAKHDYLQHAVALAASVGARSASASPFAHVSLSAVAATAGVNRSTLYRMWPSQQEFWDELLAFVIDGETSSAHADRPPEVAGEDHAGAGDVHDVMQAVLLSSRDSLVELGVIGQPIDAVSRGPIASRRADRLSALAVELGQDLHRRRSECRDGLSTRDLAVALTMLGTGLPVTGRLVQPAHLTFDGATYEPPPEAGRSLFGTLQVAILAALTMPERSRSSARSIPSPSAVTARGAPSSGRRREYLRIGARLASDPDADEHGIGRALRYLTLDALARSIGVTRRTLGSVWPTQESFRLDLLAFTMRAERGDVAQAIRSTRRGVITGDIRDAGAAFLDLGERICTALLRRRHDLSFVAFAPHFDEVIVTDRARQEHDQALVLVRHALELLLQSVAVRPLPGVTPDHLATALLVMCDGANRLIRTDPQLVDTDRDIEPGRPSIIALTMARALEQLVTRVDDTPQISRYLRLVS